MSKKILADESVDYGIVKRIETTIETLTEHFEKIINRFSVLTHNGLRIKKISVKT